MTVDHERIRKAIREILLAVGEDPDRPLRDIQEYLKTARRDLRWTPRAFEAAQKTLSIVNPELATVDPTQAYTYDYLDKLRDMGFNAQVGAPT